jgi:hypothetical protein
MRDAEKFLGAICNARSRDILFILEDREREGRACQCGGVTLSRKFDAGCECLEVAVAYVSDRYIDARSRTYRISCDVHLSYARLEGFECRYYPCPSRSA